MEYKFTSFGNNDYIIISKEVFYLINKVEIASVNTAKLPVLTNKEKNELFKKAESMIETLKKAMKDKGISA